MAHILVVDDDDATRLMLRTALEDAGHTVLEVSDGTAALNVLRASLQPLVVALDLVMPGGDGVSVLRAVRDDARLAERHRFVAMTALPLSHVDLSPDLSGLLARPVISKPFRLDELLAAVDEAATHVPAEP